MTQNPTTEVQDLNFRNLLVLPSFGSQDALRPPLSSAFLFVSFGTPIGLSTLLFVNNYFGIKSQKNCQKSPNTAQTKILQFFFFFFWDSNTKVSRKEFGALIKHLNLGLTDRETQSTTSNCALLFSPFVLEENDGYLHV